MRPLAALPCLLALPALVAAATPPARASEPGDGEGSRWEHGPAAPRPHGRADATGHGRPPRRVTGGPGYVGSDWGIGKPSYYGVGPRPDWGRSSTD